MKRFGKSTPLFRNPLPVLLLSNLVSLDLKETSPFSLVSLVRSFSSTPGHKPTVFWMKLPVFTLGFSLFTGHFSRITVLTGFATI